MKKGHEFEGEWRRIYGNVFRNDREEVNIVIILESQKEKQAKKNKQRKTQKQKLSLFLFSFLTLSVGHWQSTSPIYKMQGQQNQSLQSSQNFLETGYVYTMVVHLRKILLYEISESTLLPWNSESGSSQADRYQRRFSGGTFLPGSWNVHLPLSWCQNAQLGIGHIIWLICCIRLQCESVKEGLHWEPGAWETKDIRTHLLN